MGKINFTVDIRWCDATNQTKVFHPLIGNLVIIYYVCDLVPFFQFRVPLTSGYLNDDGIFEGSIDKSKVQSLKNGTVFIASIFSCTENCKVAYVKNKEDYSYSFDIEHKYCTNNDNLSFSRVIPQYNTSCASQAFMVAQMAQLGARYLKEQMNMKPEEVVIEFPSRSGETFANYSKNRIDLDKDRHIYPSIIIHEYGHIVESMIWGYKARGAVNSSHALNQDLTANRTKTVGLRLAFIEGYATYFASRVVQQYRRLLVDVPYVGQYDNMFFLYQGGSDIDGNASRIEVHGEGNERCIYSFLHDITDSESDEDLSYVIPGSDSFAVQRPNYITDDFSIDNAGLLKIFKKMDTINLQCFVNVLLNEYKNNKEKIRFLLSLHGIAPYAIKGTISQKDDSVKIEWIPGGCKKSSYYKANDELVNEQKECKTYQDEFKVYVFMPDGTKISETTKPIKTNYYNIKWSQVSKYVGKFPYFHVRVEGTATDRINTTYSSCAFNIPFDSYANSSGMFLLSSILSSVEDNSKSYKNITIDGKTIGVKSYNVNGDNKNRFVMNDNSNMVFKIDGMYNDISLGVTDFTYPRGTLIQISYKIKGSDGFKNFDYMTKEDKIGKILCANLDENVEEVAVCVRCSPNKPLVFNCIEFRNRPLPIHRPKFDEPLKTSPRDAIDGKRPISIALAEVLTNMRYKK